MMLEVVVQSLDDALLAEQAGANRLELCSAIQLGGLTPSVGTLRAIKSHCRLPVRALIRNRTGSFVFSAAEKAAMNDDVRSLLDAGADGVVVGALQPADSKLKADAGFLESVMATAAGRPVTFHRAFDQISEPLAAMEEFIRLGLATILTSGCAASAREGSAMLTRLVQESNGRIEILTAGGIRSSNVAELVKSARLSSVHCGPFREKAVGTDADAAISRGFPRLELDAVEVSLVASELAKLTS